MKRTSKNSVTTIIKFLIKASTVKKLLKSSNKSIVISLATLLQMEQPLPLAKLQPLENQKSRKKSKKSKKSKKN